VPNARSLAPYTSHATWWENEFKLYIPEFKRGLQPKEFLVREAVVVEVLYFKEVHEDRRVSLVATKLTDEDS
jgi:hypothetical protein